MFLSYIIRTLYYRFEIESTYLKTFILVSTVASGIINNSSRIIFYLRFKKSGISFWRSIISTFLPNQVSFHSFSFLSTKYYDISA